MTILADSQIFFGHRPVQSRIGKGYRMNDRAGAMAAGVALAKTGLVETVNLNHSSRQVAAVAFPALVGSLTVGSAMTAAPVVRVSTGAVQGRGLVIGLAAGEERTACYCQEKDFDPSRL